MNDLYQLLQVSGGKEDSKSIIKILNSIKQGTLQNDLRLLNYYNEIPVSYPARIDLIDGDMVDVSAHQQQVVVMHHDKMTFLKSRHFPHDVIAKVFRADINRCLAILTNFAYAQVRAERRQFVRVKISDRIGVTLQTPGKKIDGYLADISLGGLSFFAGSSSGAEVLSSGTLSMAIQSSPVEIPATLLKIVEEEDGYRFICEIDTTGKLEARVSQFIFQRQLEIIRELKESA